MIDGLIYIYEKMRFILMAIAVIMATAVKGQVDPVKPGTIPDSVLALNDCFFKIEKLDQYQKEKRKFGSPGQNGDIRLSVHVMQRSFFKEDSGKNIIVGFINEKRKADWEVAYIVRFDSAHHVLSVNKPHAMTNEETALALAPKR